MSGAADERAAGSACCPVWASTAASGMPLHGEGCPSLGAPLGEFPPVEDPGMLHAIHDIGRELLATVAA